MTLFFSAMGSWMLHHYSTRMIQDLYVMPDGRTIEVTFFNAFWVSLFGNIRACVDSEDGQAANFQPWLLLAESPL
jgi:hypothetical protein